MNLDALTQLDDTARRRFEIEARMEAEYAEFDRRLAGYIDGLVTEIERLIDEASD